MHTITNQYLAQYSAINLRRHTSRKVARHRDLRAAEGIIISVMIGGNVLLWSFVIARWLLA